MSMSQKRTNQKLPDQYDYCFECRKTLNPIKVHDDLFYLVCTNQECKRFGLLTVVSYKFIPKRSTN